jgi:putative transposase
MFGISRQAYYKRQQKLAQLEEERDVILNLIRPIRKKMYRVGTIKLYEMIKQDMSNNNIKLGRDKLFSFLRQEN